MQITHLDDLITRELKERNVCSIASHEVAIQDPQNTLVCNDEQIGLFPLKLENNGFQSNSQVVIRLQKLVSCHVDCDDQDPVLTSARG